MREMLRTIKSYLEKGEPLVLLTVTATSGATPRGAGARMLVGKDGRIAGTIGGGAVEYRAEHMALDALKHQESGIRAFSLTRNDVEDLGMICGGDVTVFFHYMPPKDSHMLALIERAEELFAADIPFWLLSDLSRGGEMSLYNEKEGLFGNCRGWDPAFLSRRLTHVREGAADLTVEQVNSPGRVYIFGGGHVAQELEPLLTRVGFRCVVLEDRAEFASRKFFPTAEEVLHIDFGNVAEAVQIGAEDYVCVMTRGHRHDTLIQAQVLPCRPCYVGVIGSGEKSAEVRRTLKEQYGLTEELLALVTTPIGLPIHSETPAEIAVSIAAEMIQIRAERG